MSGSQTSESNWEELWKQGNNTDNERSQANILSGSTESDLASYESEFPVLSTDNYSQNQQRDPYFDDDEQYAARPQTSGVLWDPNNPSPRQVNQNTYNNTRRIPQQYVNQQNFGGNEYMNQSYQMNNQQYPNNQYAMNNQTSNNSQSYLSNDFLREAHPFYESQPKIRILKKKPQETNTQNTNSDSKIKVETKTLQQREIEYAKAREAIGL